MDRRTSIKWVLAASASLSLLRTRGGRGAESALAEPMPAMKGYGTDPDLLKTYHPGEVWPLTLSRAQRQLAAVLSDLIIPADEHYPSATSVGVVDFIDEWVSAPYPEQARDRPIVLGGLRWLDEEMVAVATTNGVQVQGFQEGSWTTRAAYPLSDREKLSADQIKRAIRNWHGGLAPPPLCGPESSSWRPRPFPGSSGVVSRCRPR